MAYRNIIVESEATLTLKNNQLCIKTWQTDATVPIEDIDTLLIEDRKTTLSVAVLGALAKSGAAVFTCDEFHMPCAVITPYLQHSRQHEVTERQLALTAPAKKQMWKQIVSAKISNQAKCLLLCNRAKDMAEVISKLENLAKNVRSGDEGHSEGYAAAMYFPALFGVGYRRGDDFDQRNAWLNYGYSILRGCIARTLCVYGFFPLFGIQHHSSLNQFNLADDFIEPFRQIVDLYVSQNATREKPLSPEYKRQLVRLVSYDMVVSGKKYALSYAIERTIKSFSAVCSGNQKQLLLPELVALKQHVYE